MKYKTIATLESALKQIEIDYCFATRGNDREGAESLYRQRGEVIRELQRVS
jgi:hypothetical protein